jgi:hypothetical protein
VRFQQAGQNYCSNGHAAFQEPAPQLVDRARDSLLRCILIDAQGLPDLAQALVSKIAEQDGFAVQFCKLGHSFVQERCPMLPLAACLDALHDECLLFAVVAATFPAQRLGRRVARRLVKPAREHGLPGELGCLLGQERKHDLGDILGQGGITNLAQRRRIDQWQVPFHQRTKCPFRPVASVFLQ